MRSPGGDAVSVSGVRERRVEIEKWNGHLWFRVLWKLNADLTLLDMNYTLVQCKEKFGRLRYYIHSDASISIKVRMNRLVTLAEKEIDELEKSEQLRAIGIWMKS